ncbi:SusC/RagA family TonB-linked outer membrane protein [Salmonirosea aquatica]|uniref:SusC/RagA family TonB-linked outer membrane protein n=1 Tax=Salmonirosea aquatica TaxID=2654236 RepID=A0A7C9BE37_9BACT|nr:SusC/RagA family TonB-linked outer membrane protein [Cytophagaceae bacterium SJW1-29]
MMNLLYRCLGTLLIGVGLLLLSGSTYAQNRILRGKVLEAGPNTPLPGASVIVAGSNQGTTTDANGTFSLSVPESAQQLVVSFVGYTRQEVPITNAGEYTVSLVSEESSLSEVVVIGYGSREKKDLTGAISTVSSKEISKSIAQAPELAMQGRMAGVYVSTPGGSPLARPQVRIRGVGTFGNAEPLYVVDGIPLTEFGSGTDNASGSITRDIRGNVNVLSMINPNDIESISVLKDASAAAIYGVRAANGVVLITTKKGAKGAPKVDFSLSHSIQNVTKKLNMLDVPQFTALYREAYANNPNEAVNLPAQFNPDSPNYLGNLPTTDWQTPLLNRNAPNTDYSLRVSGGNESTRYYVSAGYTDTEGPLIQNNLKRYTLATNVDTKISKYLSTGLTYRLAYSEALDNTPSALQYAADTSPWQPIYDADGPLGYAPSVNVTFAPNPELGAPLSARPQYLPSIPPFVIDQSTLLWGPETNNNSFGSAATTDNRYTLLRNIGTAFIQLEPLPGLRFKGTLSADFYYNRRNSWTDVRNYLFLQNPGNPYSVGDGTSKGTYGERHTRNTNIVKEFSINYTKAFGDHHLDLLANAMDQRYVYEFLQGGASQIQFSQPQFRSLTNIQPYTNVSSLRDINALQGYLGRVSYHYASRYYLDATLRRDGASRFAPGYKWGTFPAISAAWRISAEPFMKSATFIDDLKIRGGWGKLGNQETRSFAYLSLVSDAPDYALGSGNGNAIGTLLNGVSLPDFPVQNLTWEVSTTSSLGVDASFFNGKLTATVEYYNRLTSGILQSANLAASVGNQNQPILNIASVRNSGVEFQLGYNGSIGDDFQYNLSGNLTTTKNAVVSTFQNQPFGGEFGRIEVGKPIGYLWGYKVGGIFQNQSEIDTWKSQYSDATNNNNFAPGDMYFQDVKGNPTEAGQLPSDTPDGVVNSNDRTFLGSTIPGYYYGVNLGGSYKGFDLSIFFQGVGDVYRYNSWRAAGESMSSTGTNQWTTTLDRWTPENPSTTMPRAVRSDPANNNRFSDRFVESAAFLRLKNVQLGYSIPASLTKSLGFINGLRAYVGATNLFVITPWTGPDPEDIDRGGSELIPPVRSVTLGITASF